MRYDDKPTVKVNDCNFNFLCVKSKMFFVWWVVGGSALEKISGMHDISFVSVFRSLGHFHHKPREQ